MKRSSSISEMRIWGHMLCCVSSAGTWIMTGFFLDGFLLSTVTWAHCGDAMWDCSWELERRHTLLSSCSWRVSFGTSCGSCSWGCLRGGNMPAPRRCRISSALGMFSPCRAVRAERDNIECQYWQWNDARVLQDRVLNEPPRPPSSWGWAARGWWRCSALGRSAPGCRPCLLVDTPEESLPSRPGYCGGSARSFLL